MSYVKLKAMFDEFQKVNIDELSIEQLVDRTKIASEFEKAFVSIRRRSEINCNYLLSGRKDGRRTKFQYWGDEVTDA